MAESVVDIIHKLTYEVNNTGIKQTADIIGSQLGLIAKLQNSLSTLKAKYDATTDPARQERYAQAIQKVSDKIKLQQSNVENLYLSDKKFQDAVVREIGLIGKLGSELQILQEKRKRATTETDIARYNTQIAQTQGKLNSLLNTGTEGFNAYAKGGNNAASATFALSQILRETPAFAYSVQTGILAISNNLPILVDEFNRLKVAQGGANSALKVLGKSLFSFPNLLTIGIGLLTIFSGKLLDMASSEKEATKETEEFNKAQKDLAQTLGKELANIETLVRTANNLEASYKERGAAVDELQKQYPEYFGQLEREKILNGEVQGTYDALTASIIKRARVTAQQKLLEDAFARRQEAATRLDRIQNPGANAFVIADAGEEERLQRVIKGLDLQIERIAQGIQAENESFEASALAIDEKTKKEFDAYRNKTKLEATLTQKEKDELEKRKKDFDDYLEKRKQAYANALIEFKQLTKKAIDDPDLESIVDKVLGATSGNAPVEMQRFIAIKPSIITETEERLSGGFSSANPDRLRAQLEIREDLKERDKKDAEERKTAREKELEEVQAYYDAIANAALQAFSVISSAQRQQLDAEISIRERKVEEATKLAERGNTEVLRIEQERLNEALQNRQENARQEQLINSALALSYSIAAVAKAGLEGGALAPATIAATIAAIVAGYAVVKTATSEATPGFFDGGYVGDKGTREVAGVVHGKEFVVNAENTKKFRPILEMMNEGKVPYLAQPLNQFASRTEMGNVEKKLDSLIEAVEGNKTKVVQKVTNGQMSLMVERYKKQQRNRWS